MCAYSRSKKADTSRILVVDDHPMMRRGVRDTVETQSDLAVTAEAEDVRTAMDLLRKSQFDLVILDISFASGSNGLELIKDTRARGDETKILVFSLHDESLYAERVLRAGAQGYITKSASTDELLNAIRRVLNGDLYLSSRMSNVLLRRAMSGKGTVPLTQSLSDRELEVLELIGRGLTTRQIAENLCLSDKTVETHRQNMKTKLGLTTGAQLVRHAIAWVTSDQQTSS